MRSRAKLSMLFVVIALVCIMPACSAPQQEAPPTSAEESSSTEATGVTGPIIEAAHWEQEFPNQYNSYLEAGHATYAHDGATGKVNAHTDVMNPPPGYPAPFMTGCLSCHSSAYQSVVMDELGEDLFTTDVETVKGMIDEGITCYSCHENTPGQMAPVNQWVLEAAEIGGIETSPENMVCGQCHSMGDFSVQFSDPDSSKWSFLQLGVDPDVLWDYMVSNNNEIPIVPTAETVFNNFLGSTHDTAGATCISCHTETTVDDEGNSFTRHQFQSVGTNPNLFNKCQSCHTDTAREREAALEAYQASFIESRDSVQATIDTLKLALDEAAQNNTSEDVIGEATTLYNKAVFYLAYGSDQGNGVHSMGTGTATADCHETAEQAANEGLSLLK